MTTNDPSASGGPIFLTEPPLGLLADHLHSALKAESARERQRRVRRLLLILKELGVIPSGAWPVGFAYGINTLGHRGFWILYEAGARVEAPLPEVGAESEPLEWPLQSQKQSQEKPNVDS